MAFLVYTDKISGELVAFADFGLRGREGLAAVPLLSGAWVNCPYPASTPLMCLLPAPLPQVDTLSMARALPKSGEIVSTLGHTLAQRWDSRVTIYRSESSSEQSRRVSWALPPLLTLGPCIRAGVWASDPGHHSQQSTVSWPPGESGRGTEGPTSEQVLEGLGCHVVGYCGATDRKPRSAAREPCKATCILEPSA